MALTVLSCVAPVEAVFIDGFDDVVGGAVKELSLVVLMTVPLLHVTLLEQQALPQHWVLDSLDLKIGEDVIGLMTHGFP